MTREFRCFSWRPLQSRFVPNDFLPNSNEIKQNIFFKVALALPFKSLRVIYCQHKCKMYKAFWTDRFKNMWKVRNTWIACYYQTVFIINFSGINWLEKILSSLRVCATQLPVSLCPEVPTVGTKPFVPNLYTTSSCVRSLLLAAFDSACLFPNSFRFRNLLAWRRPEVSGPHQQAGLRLIRNGFRFFDFCFVLIWFDSLFNVTAFPRKLGISQFPLSMSSTFLFIGFQVCGCPGWDLLDLILFRD